LPCLLRDLLFEGDRLGLGIFALLLFVFEELGCADDAIARIGGVVPTLDLNPLALEILIDGEEVGDFFEHVGVDIGVVPDVGVAGVVFADGEHLFVEGALVEHFEEADGAHLVYASGEGGVGNEYQHVEWIAVVAEGGRDEAVVTGVVNGGVQVAVELKDVQLLVVLELVGTVLGDLDDRPEDFRRTIADRELQIINHSFLHPLGVGSGRQMDRNFFRCALCDGL